jgi:magnesium-transporting ATPase (P-type)
MLQRDDGCCCSPTPTSRSAAASFPPAHARGLILLEDTVRPDAPEILRFFAEQGVQLKVISGDNVATVAAVAKRAGVAECRCQHRCPELTDDESIAKALETTTVFGRVTPHQKRAMVAALQAKGRVVAMTGDGVNDVLALKDADMGIAMGSGSAASRGVAQLVLLDNRFATLPEVLAQGARSSTTSSASPTCSSPRPPTRCCSRRSSASSGSSSRSCPATSR